MIAGKDTELKVGREMDALVAEIVLGCKVTWQTYPGTGEDYPHCNCTGENHGPHAYDHEVWDNELAHYSTDIAAAFEVVDKLKELNVHIALYWERTHNRWDVYFETHGSSASSESTSLPEAICRAALKAVNAPD